MNKYRIYWREWIRSGSERFQGHEVLCSGETIVLDENEDAVKFRMSRIFKRMEIISVTKD